MQYVHVWPYAKQSYKYTYTCLHIHRHMYKYTSTDILTRLPILTNKVSDPPNALISLSLSPSPPPSLSLSLPVFSPLFFSISLPLFTAKNKTKTKQNKQKNIHPKTLILRVPDQNGVSQAWYTVEKHHSGWEPSIRNHDKYLCAFWRTKNKVSKLEN